MGTKHPVDRYSNRYIRRNSHRCQCTGKGTTNGLITDIDGNFSLIVSPNATIVISYVGYTTQEIPLNGRKTLNVVLKEDNEMLDEVVVIGYGTMKRAT